MSTPSEQITARSHLERVLGLPPGGLLKHELTLLASQLGTLQQQAAKSLAGEADGIAAEQQSERSKMEHLMGLPPGTLRRQ